MQFRNPRSCRIMLFFVALAAGLVLSGCQGSEEGNGEGPGHRSQTLALSPQQELELGREAYREVLGNPEKYGRALPADSSECRRVRAVARRIIKASAIEPLQREMNLRKGFHYEWEVNVLQNNQVNAFCLPGGKIAVFTGLLRVVQNDDQLATVLGHEIGHALAHHTSERIARKQMNPVASGGLWGKAFDRAQESEADHIGVFLMTFAGYDPDQAVVFWKRMERLNRNQPPEILSDHPSDEHRIQALEKWVSKAKAAKSAYDHGDIAPASQ